MIIAPGLLRCPTVVHALAGALAQVPFVTALVCEERRLSYAELGRAVSGLARVLATLGARGERVVVLLPTSIEAVVSALAVLAARAQLAPVDPSVSAAVLERILTQAEPCLIVCDATSRAALAAIESRRALPHTLVWGSPELDASAWLADDSLDLAALELPKPDELALLLFSRCTTGAPRGVEHAHRGVALSLLQHCTCWPVASGRDRFLDVASLFDVWGLIYATLVPIYARATRVLVPHFDAERVLAAIEQHAISVFAGGPAAIYSSLIANARFGSTDFSSLRHALSDGSALPPELCETWQQGTRRPLLTSWSLAQAAPLCLSDARVPGKPGSVGRAAPLTQISIVDRGTGRSELPANQPGEVRARGPQLMLGYLDRPEATSVALRGGWLYTGEIGYLDEDGFLFLVEHGKRAPAFDD